MSTTRNMHAIYSEYRYGPRRPVLLPGQQTEPKRILRGQKRKHVVSEIIDLLKGWQKSPFQYEAAARAGLRAGLVLEGNRWKLADLEADLVVAEGLRVIGAERPDWEEAQPRYVDRGDFCARCGKPMPDELVEGKRAQRFCSAECAAATLEDRFRKDVALGSTVTRAAQSLIRREKLPPSTCRYCGTAFRPLKDTRHGTQQFCSNRCFTASRVVHPEVKCLACGKLFRTRKKGDRLQQFCSAVCRNSYGRTMEYTLICEACGDQFVSKAHNGRFCTPSCKTFEGKHTRGVYTHKTMSGRLFDYLFTAPAALARAAM